MQDDLDAIRKGTLTGSAAVTQVQTDTAAVLTSMGLTSTQISQIQTDQAAVETAIQANSSSGTATTTSSSTETTLQSVAGYLVGLPGVSGMGVRGMGGFGACGSGWGPRGGFMTGAEIAGNDPGDRRGDPLSFRFRPRAGPHFTAHTSCIARSYTSRSKTTAQ